MAPKTSSTRSKRGLAQPTLSFQQRKSSTTLSKKSSSAKSLPRTNSTTSIDLSEPDTHIVPSVNVVPEPHGAKIESEKILGEGEQGKRARRRLDPKDPKWKNAKKRAAAEMGFMQPIHAGPETHNDIHHILRVFDLTASYGPCVGVTRLQRWERAKKWGLNPPEEIKEILTTQEGEDEIDYRENVLHPWLG